VSNGFNWRDCSFDAVQCGVGSRYSRYNRMTDWSVGIKHYFAQANNQRRKNGQKGTVVDFTQIGRMIKK